MSPRERRQSGTDGLAKDGVSVAGNDLATVEGLPDVLLNLLVGRVLADLLLHLGDPVEDLLVGETERERRGASISTMPRWKEETRVLTRGGVQQDR